MMSPATQMLFVYAAYGVVLIGTALLSLASYRAMRRAEAAADALRRGE